MNTALLGVDYIVDIMHPDGKITRSASSATERDDRAIVVEDACAAVTADELVASLAMLSAIATLTTVEQLPALA